ncbi:MAG: class I tRNA ligase family protein, partial [Chthoniobacterales bacterium]|nr:class I tRNA ligase family protein [Chthoniobacterales bacterium]
FVGDDAERYWMGAAQEAGQAARSRPGGVDLYVGGTEHAVLHLLYARFWHKVLFDLGHVSTLEPFNRLVNQGLILGEMEYTAFRAGDKPISASELRDLSEEATESGKRMIAFHKQSGEKLIGQRVGEDEVEKETDGYYLKAHPEIRVDARSFKMSKSRGNVVNPDAIVEDYGADSFRLYEMYMGPLEAQKPWATRDIIGMTRFLNAVWRNIVGDEESSSIANRKSQIANVPIPGALERQMHRAIKKVGENIAALRFNTAIAELIKLNNEMSHLREIPRQLAETFILLLAPLAPHIAEEVWQRLGHPESLARHPWPEYDDAKLVESSVELAVQVNGKVRDRITIDTDADEATVFAAAENTAAMKPWLDGKTIRKRLYVPKKLVNFVVG